MTLDEFNRKRWSRYLALEDNFISTEEYVTLDLGENYLYVPIRNIGSSEESSPQTILGNSLTFSDEYQTLLGRICAECDDVMARICDEVIGFENIPGVNELKGCNMGVYKEQLPNEWPSIPGQKVEMLGAGSVVVLRPFKEWEVADTLTWWNANNKLKHDGLQNRTRANLKNVVNALAGLFVIDNYLVKWIAERDGGVDCPKDASKLFKMVNFTRMFNLL